MYTSIPSHLATTYFGAPFRAIQDYIDLNSITVKCNVLDLMKRESYQAIYTTVINIIQKNGDLKHLSQEFCDRTGALASAGKYKEILRGEFGTFIIQRVRALEDMLLELSIEDGADLIVHP